MGSRSSGLDALKILASLGVVFLHVSAYSRDFGNLNEFTITSFIYYLGTLSIPIFFTLNGYFLLKKENLTWNYIFKKIINILLVSLFWCGVIWVLGRNFNDNLLKKFLGSFLQRGYFYQFWFFGSLMIIYLLLPWLQKLKSKIWLFLLLTLLSELVMITSLIFGKAIQSEVTQTFRLWTWLNYFLLGGVLDTIFNWSFVQKHQKKLAGLASLLLLGLPVVVFFLSQLVNNYYAEYYYDMSYVKVLTVLLVFQFQKLKLNATFKRLIKSLSGLTMGIFIVHTYVLRIANIIPFFKNPYFNILGIMIVYGLSGGLIFLLKKSKIGQKVLEI